MAKNREPEKPLVSESESESDEDDDEVSSDEAGSSSSDSEPTLTPSTKNPPTVPGPKKSQPQLVLKPLDPSSSSEEEDEESGSEPVSDTDPVNSNVRLLLSKPTDEPRKPFTSAAAAKKPRSKPNASQPSTQVKSTGAKRPAEEEKEADAKENKRSKKKPPPDVETSGKPASTSNDDSKKQLFQRLWSEDDEIVVLKGMIDYASQKKSDPVADLNDFHDFIRENLHVDATRTQLQDKIRRLKKNENDNGSEGEKAVGSPKANDTATRKIPNKGVTNVENSNFKEVKSLDIASADVKMMIRSFGGGSNNGLSTREWILRAGAEFFEGENKIEGHKEWRKLRVEEIELEEKIYDVMQAQTKLVLNVMRATNH
ncbi:GLABROUS1 enhancer-binding -like [Olea europaea subsp. europaea]|uniref:GLABROUS1 enhancer-binding -like n=1 Tax=Olea europaea subsp. europaea TaxID=158383 RepID=A0A8S0UB05_OLEEU|nr:GLABROUS1 enhancer-binding -like [Olea europaea subsp. europaea]